MEPVKAFEILSLKPGEYSHDELKSAYRERVKVVHPDRGGRREDFEALEMAYEILRAVAPNWQEDEPDPWYRRVLDLRLWWVERSWKARVGAVAGSALALSAAGLGWLWIEGLAAGVPWQPLVALTCVPLTAVGLYLHRNVPR